MILYISMASHSRPRPFGVLGILCIIATTIAFLVESGITILFCYMLGRVSPRYSVTFVR